VVGTGTRPSGRTDSGTTAPGAGDTGVDPDSGVLSGVVTGGVGSTLVRSVHHGGIPGTSGRTMTGRS
jgi:hypothetical protein